ncbi:TonB-dependent receptor [Luteimonas sp. TWI662]|uniref:TonB-dependent receptor domain-containing protein n=1 Tax=Luteimonas sp. TWI662 TaxID=3136789 RepID=UPI00320B1382
MNATRSPRVPQPALLACALAACLAVAAPAFAQSTSATLRGQVRSAEAGTTVTATNVATGAVRRVQTNAGGAYTLVGLPPGTYRVDAGGEPQTVTLSVASTATLDIQGAVAEGVPADGPVTDIGGVTVTAPLLRDVRTSEVGNTISLRQIQQLPQATRNFLEFADTVPGMQFKIDAQGRATLRAGATNTSSSNLYIDGVSQKSYVQQGGIAGQNESPGNPFPQLAIGEYKVITSNYKAEYGQVSGAAITAATRSGTNAFEGEMFYRFTNERMRAKRPDETDKDDSQVKEYGFALGGPIIEDRMHFFVAYEGKKNIYARSVQPEAASGEAYLRLPDNLRSYYGATTLPFAEDLYFAKLSWDIGDNDRLELSGQYRDEDVIGNVGGISTPEHGDARINEDKRVNLKWMHYGQRFYNELIVSTQDSQNSKTPVSFGNGAIYTVIDRRPPLTEATLLQLGPASGFSLQSQHQKGWSLQNDLTFNSFEFNGDHTVKVGVNYRDIELASSDGEPLNPQFSWEFDPATGQVAAQPYRVEFIAPFATPGLTPRVETTAKQYGFYIQDDWQVNPHLMLNFGVRWDYEDVPAYTDHVTPKAFVDALYAADPQNPGQRWVDRWLNGGIDAINPLDYISTGSNRKNFKDAWAPRFGFSYDLGADERHVIHGGAGRSYDRNLFRDLAFERHKGSISLVRLEFADPATGQCVAITGSRCVAWDPAYLGGADVLAGITGSRDAAEAFMLNNRLKTPYSDQFSLGMSNQVGQWLTDVTVQRILARDGFGYTLGNRYPDGAFFSPDGSPPWGASDRVPPGFGGVILGDNGVEQRSTQILLAADKPYTKESGWGANIAYTHTQARQNSRDNDSQFDYFDKARLQYFPFVKSSNQPKHRFTASASVDGPWGVTYGAKLVLETANPINTVACYGVQGWDGSTCQLVGFVPPGNGKFLVGGDIWSYRTVDLQATKEFVLGGDTRLTARVNLLNAFNFKNYDSYVYGGPDGSSNYFGEGGQLDTGYVSVNRNAGIFYFPRTLTVEVGLKF